jgi:hypothetical protein
MAVSTVLMVYKAKLMSKRPSNLAITNPTLLHFSVVCYPASVQGRIFKFRQNLQGRAVIGLFVRVTGSISISDVCGTGYCRFWSRRNTRSYTTLSKLSQIEKPRFRSRLSAMLCLI